MLLNANDLKILGLARAFDFVIRIPDEQAYTKLHTGDHRLLQTLVHEWTHYIQFLSTSLGNFVAELERNIFLSKLALVIRISKVTRGEWPVPIAPLLEEENAITTSPEVAPILEAFHQLAECRATLDARWSLGARIIDPGEIRRRKLLRLDPSAGALLFELEGTTHHLDISVRQLMEHAAKANELLAGGCETDASQLNTALFDYYAFLLYLHQQGHIEIEKLPDGRIRVADLADLMVFYACCQIALMLYVGKPAETSGGSSPGEHHWATMPTVEWAAECRLQSAKTLCALLDDFPQVLMTFARANSAMEAIESVCARHDRPSYFAVVEVQRQMAEGLVAATRRLFAPQQQLDAELGAVVAAAYGNPDRRESPEFDLSAMLTRVFVERAAIAFEALLTTGDATLNPVMSADLFPAPYILYEADDGAHRAMLKFPWQTNPRLHEIPKSDMTYLQETEMLLDKFIFDTNLACYRDGGTANLAMVNRASMGCRDFARCFRSSRMSHLDFCTHDHWQRTAGGMLQSFRGAGRVLHDRP